MAKRTPPTYPRARLQLKALGERLVAARQRRRMSQSTMAERIGVTVATLAKLERGDPGVSFATALRALHVLGLGDDIDRLAADDPLGRAIQDEHLVGAPRGASKR